MSGMADDIARGLLRERRPVHVAPECFACGRSYSRRGDGRFCSTMCRSAFDNGFPPHAPVPTLRDGVHITCSGCQKTFTSRGLRCCSTDCERKFREHENTVAVMAEVGIVPSVKRKCQQCGAKIPKWLPGGRATPISRKFCSAKCSARARKAS